MKKSFPFALQVSQPPVKQDDVDITIIIAHRGPGMGLWMTIQGCEIELADSGLKYDYVVVHNGDPDMGIETRSIMHHLERSGRRLDFIHHPAPLSPPSARQLATESADGKYLFFFDNHCIPARGYFTNALRCFEEQRADMVHSMTRFFAGEKDHYHYRLHLDSNFWGESVVDDPYGAQSPDLPRRVSPYRIAVAGHGGFAVRRSVWEEVGGYGPLGMFTGYGGEEVYFDLKMAMMDKTNWLVPQMVHHHWSGERAKAIKCEKCGEVTTSGYSRHYSDDYFRNMLMCANIVGGPKWCDKVYMHFMNHPKQPGKTMYDLYMEAIYRSDKHGVAYRAKCRRTLEQQLDEFKRLGIPH